MPGCDIPPTRTRLQAIFLGFSGNRLLRDGCCSFGEWSVRKIARCRLCCLLRFLAAACDQRDDSDDGWERDAIWKPFGFSWGIGIFQRCACRPGMGRWAVSSVDTFSIFITTAFTRERIRRGRCWCFISSGAYGSGSSGGFVGGSCNNRDGESFRFIFWFADWRGTGIATVCNRVVCAHAKPGYCIGATSMDGVSLVRAFVDRSIFFSGRSIGQASGLDLIAGA